jgi:hypothetical protein
LKPGQEIVISKASPGSIAIELADVSLNMLSARNIASNDIRIRGKSNHFQACMGLEFKTKPNLQPNNIVRLMLAI